MVEIITARVLLQQSLFLLTGKRLDLCMISDMPVRTLRDVDVSRNGTGTRSTPCASQRKAVTVKERIDHVAFPSPLGFKEGELQRKTPQYIRPLRYRYA